MQTDGQPPVSMVDISQVIHLLGQKEVTILHLGQECQRLLQEIERLKAVIAALEPFIPRHQESVPVLEGS